ncbi:MAG: 2-hydroxychromene-2-carboxylate isomerase [Proteobacteria bacterium]|nr:MAG: 2-hydroxychromene-2-carboxylate isomerase [Pseudomonadota bacterium]
MRPTVDWVFDFISPFAYLQSQQLAAVAAVADIRPVPVVFAGLLDHWGQRGPAEIPAKRRFTYRHVRWLAEQAGLPLVFPPAHPFNPIAALRLAVVADDLAAIQAMFRVIWGEGQDPNAEAGWAALSAAAGLSPEAAREAVAQPDCKARLRANGEAALAAGVFGVPTLLVDGEPFWGADATGMALAALADPAHFASAEYRRLDTLPEAAGRRPS